MSTTMNYIQEAWAEICVGRYVTVRRGQVADSWTHLCPLTAHKVNSVIRPHLIGLALERKGEEAFPVLTNTTVQIESP